MVLPQQSQKEHLIAKLQNEIASTQSQKMELELLIKKNMEEIEILRCSGTTNSASDEVRWFYFDYFFKAFFDSLFFSDSFSSKKEC